MDVMILTGAGQIGMAIARRMGYGMKIVIGDKSKANADAIAKTMMNM
jgi:saccharopine dehydrogenase-like NADP-dependent oxidoreductase